MTIHMLIRGGLGNQMFQAAMAMAIEERWQIPVDLIDLTNRARVERNWQLGIFGIPASRQGQLHRTALLAEFRLRHTLARSGHHDMLGLLHDGAPYHGSRPPRFAYGYFQGMRHMRPIIARACERFVFPALPDHRALSAPQRPRVALHVRRGDYLTDQIARDYHHVCTPQWYVGAIAEARRRLGDIELVLVSDDVHGAAADLALVPGDYTTLPTRSGDADWMDLAQMAALPHFILSNSSFSWWAAQLSPEPASMVIAPRRWYPTRETRALGIEDDHWILL